MAPILVPIQTRNHAVLSISRELLSAARHIASGSGGEVEALLLSDDPSATAAQIGSADRVLTMAHPALRDYNPEAQLMSILAAVRQRNPAAVVLAYDTMGLDLAAALSQELGWPMVGYCSSISVSNGHLTSESHIYGGRLTAQSQAALPAIITVLPGAFEEDQGGQSAIREELAPPPQLNSLRITHIETASPPMGDVDLTRADKILCVGRGIGDKDNIGAAQALAQLLGAELAGSRPVVDSGWLPKERQVGKSGKKVKPKLYLALGVSGAAEHLEGMKSSEIVIAINNDEAAPIFGTAHYGATCDLHSLIATLSARLR